MIPHVTTKLQDAFPGADIFVQDTSAGHESHNSLTNLAVSVYWKGFEGMPFTQRCKL